MPAAPPIPAAEPIPAGEPTASGEPRIGVAYPFNLLTHCGARFANFDGRYWQAVGPEPQPAPLPGGKPADFYTAGTLTLLSPDRLRFDATDPNTAAVPVGGVEFTPMPAGAQPPPCQ